MRKKQLLTAAVAAASLLSGAVAAESTSELERRIAELEQTVLILSRKLEVADEVYVADKTRAASNGRVKAGLDGFALASPDGQAEMKLRGTVQFDGRFWNDDDRDADTFLFRRVRPTIEAKLGKAAFRFTPEFAEDDADLVDGYIDWSLPAGLVLRAGQFKAPVGLERLQGASALVFNERAFPTELAPNRDRGLLLFTGLLEKRLSLEFGVTNGTPDGRNATNSDVDGEQEFSGRVFFEPIPGLGFGLSGTYGEKFGDNDVRNPAASNANAFLPRYRSPGQQQVFNYVAGSAADGDHTRISPHAYFYQGPFGLMAEYIESAQEVRLGGVTEEFTHDAAQVTAVYSLTGEAQSFRGIKPAGPGGAWELALRYASLDIDGEAFSRGFANPASSVEGADQWSVGLNWTITPNLKAFSSYSLTQFDGGAAGGSDRDDEKLLFTRLQLNY